VDVRKASMPFGGQLPGDRGRGLGRGRGRGRSPMPFGGPFPGDRQRRRKL